MKNLDTIVAESHSVTEVCKKLGKHSGGQQWRMVKKELEQHNTSHFIVNGSKPKWKRVQKNCPVCGTMFTTMLGHSREKITCSHSCSNTLFRSGERNPNWKHGLNKKRDRSMMKQYCEICEATKNLCYDHNHKTDLYRGTLCGNCNRAIGLMRENVEALQNAARYLEERNLV